MQATRLEIDAAEGHEMVRLRLWAMIAFGLIASAASAQPTVERLQIDTASGPHDYKVEVMRSRPELEQGLMFRHFLPADRGMLFDFKTPQSVMMWMKNTYLPLDMVFIDAKGKVIHIARGAEPLSLKTIPSEGDALGVLELNAGAADKIDLKEGDTVEASIFLK